MAPFDYQSLCKSWKWCIPRNFNIGADCADKYAAHPEFRKQTALIWESGDGFVKNYTFSDVSRITNKIANSFLASNINRGDRIVVMLENVPEFPFSFLAALKIGAIPIPASSMLVENEISYILRDSGAKAIVTSPELYGRIDMVRDRCPGLQTVFITGGKAPSHCVDLDELLQKSSPELEPEKTLAEDIAYLCYTSGTTGEPKGVAHAHRCIIGRDPAAFYWLGVGSRPVVFHAGKLNWTYTLGAGCLDPWRHGCACVIYGGDYDPLKMFDVIRRHRVNVFMAVPTVYRQMVKAAAGMSFDLSSISHCLSAGEGLSAELFSDCKDELGVLLYDGLGMSEFSYYISNMIGMEIKPGSPGKPQPGRNCFLINPETGQLAAKGEQGVLASAPDDPGIMLGYRNRPDETRKMFSPKGDFVSGDYFKTDDDGYLLPLGRKDDMINSFGYRISPFEIEAFLSKHRKVRDCAVAGIDAGEGKVITTAFIVAKDDMRPRDYSLKEELNCFLNRSLAKYKVPKEIIFTDSIPRTKNGKTQRSVLREQFGKPT